MLFCEFCGKGPFPSTSALNKHTRHSVNCNNAAHQKWGRYATNLWKNAPGHSNNEGHPPTSPPILEDDEIRDRLDMTLEDDLQLEGDLLITRGPQPENPPDTGIQLDQPGSVRDNEPESTYFIENFPEDLGAGAAWGEDVPFFEKLWREQQENGSSLWGPFEDQVEWDLAKWLIRNVGHKQINAFLNLHIVSSRHFVNLDAERLRTFDRHGNERRHPIITVAFF